MDDQDRKPTRRESRSVPHAMPAPSRLLGAQRPRESSARAAATTHRTGDRSPPPSRAGRAAKSVVSLLAVATGVIDEARPGPGAARPSSAPPGSVASSASAATRAGARTGQLLGDESAHRPADHGERARSPGRRAEPRGRRPCRRSSAPPRRARSHRRRGCQGRSTSSLPQRGQEVGSQSSLVAA